MITIRGKRYKSKKELTLDQNKISIGLDIF
jgi:hypothetical protein